MNHNETIKQPALVKKAEETVKRFDMLNCPAIIVGVSGGADSMALLHFLCSLREKSGLKVYAAHINHGLRGEEALRDENFVKNWCSENGVELFVLHADVNKIAKERGETVEEAGRKVRYGFFEENADKLNARIATAHTLSDNIETQILNIARGTGLHGLCGIPPVRGSIVRPLINCTRHDTEEYCKYYSIKYVDDSTNFMREYTRNRVRLDIIPILYEINSAFDRAQARLFESLAEDESFLADEAEKRLAEAELDRGVYSLSVLLKNDCHPAILKRCAAIAAARFTNTAQEAGHINTIARIASEGCGKAEIKGGFFVQSLKGRLIFSLPQSSKPQIPEDFTFPLEDGIYENRLFRLTIKRISFEIEKKFKNFNKQYFKNAIDCDKIKDNAVIRAKKQGDSFSPAGRNVTKTLKKLFNEAGIPVEERAYLPVAADSEGILWVGKFGAAERCKVTDTTHNAIIIEIESLEV